MGNINVTLPTIGQPRGAEEVDLRAALATLVGEFNGNIDAANLAPDAVGATELQAASVGASELQTNSIGDSHVTAALKQVLLGAWKTIEAQSGQFIPSSGSGLSLIGNGLLTANGAAAVAGAINVFRLSPAAEVVAGVTTRLRIVAAALTNATDAAVMFTFGLHPVTAVAGAAGALNVTAGAAVAGSTFAMTPGPSTVMHANGTSSTSPLWACTCSACRSVQHRPPTRPGQCPPGSRCATPERTVRQQR
jgi:hypothetical protein